MEATRMTQRRPAGVRACLVGIDYVDRKDTDSKSPAQPKPRGDYALVCGRCWGSLECDIDLAASQRNRVAVLQFVRRERGDRSFVVDSDLVRERTGLDAKSDDLGYLVNGVCSVVGNRSSHQAFEFLRRRCRRVIGRDFRAAKQRKPQGCIIFGKA
jgi:hypothetical protein